MFAQRARKTEKINEVVSHQNGRVNTEWDEQSREVGERERERERRRALSLSLCSVVSFICHKQRDVVGCCSSESVISEAFPVTDPASVTVGRRDSLRGCFC